MRAGPWLLLVTSGSVQAFAATSIFASSRCCPVLPVDRNPPSAVPNESGGLMKKLMLLLPMFYLLLCGLAGAQDQAKAVEENSQPALTIYNQNFFVAREHLRLELKPGVNRVEYAGISAHVEPDSVMLRDPAGRTLQILEQNYRNDPISQELLLSLYEGKTIEFLVGQDGGRPITVKGKIIRSGYVSSASYAAGYQQQTSSQPIIEVDGVLRFGLPGQPLFPALTGDSILQPTL